MLRARHTNLRSKTAFTLVELLTVIALIVTIAALAIPNFVSMMKQQRLTSAINQIQVAILRARTYAMDKEMDHAVEFCQDGNGGIYLRIDAKSTYLESVPNLGSYIQVVDTFILVPDGWIGAFLARRDAWGPTDGKRLYTGMMNVLWGENMKWQHFMEDFGSGGDNYHNGMSSPNVCHMYYDKTVSPYFPKSELQAQLATWLYPQYPSEPAGSSLLGREISVDEATNEAGTTGYMDVDETSPFAPNGDNTEIPTVMDNLAVDSMIYLPSDVALLLAPPFGFTTSGPVSSLINFNAKTNVVSGVTYNVAEYGWDATPDLRFSQNGRLIQTQAPTLVLKQGTSDIIRLQFLRGSGRLKKMQ